MAGVKGMKPNPMVIKQEAIRLFFEEETNTGQVWNQERYPACVLVSGLP